MRRRRRSRLAGQGGRSAQAAAELGKCAVSGVWVVIYDVEWMLTSDDWTGLFKGAGDGGVCIELRRVLFG